MCNESNGRRKQWRRRGRTFILNIGVNRNQAAGCDLQYAVSDAVRNVLRTPALFDFAARRTKVFC